MEETRVIDSGSGCALKIDELLPWMSYSVVEFASGAQPLDLKAFTYTRGGWVPSVGLPLRQATEADTNVDLKARTGHDTALSVYSMSYEIESINNTTDIARGNNTTPLPSTARPLRTVEPGFHRLLQVKTLVELVVGYGQEDKPKLRLPLSRVSQSVGAKVIGTGGLTYMAADMPAASSIGPSHSSAGEVRAFNQRRFNLPIEVPKDGVYYLRFWAPEGPVSPSGASEASMDNNPLAYRIRFYLDGLKLRPGVV